MGRRLRAVAKAAQLCLLAPLTLVAYALTFVFVELFYYALFRRELRLAQERTEPIPLSPERRDYLFRQMGEAMNTFGWESWREWFRVPGGDAVATPCVEDLRRFMSWALFQKPEPDLTSKERAYLCKGLTNVQLSAGHWFPKKRKEGTGEPFLHTWAPVNASYKPFLFYLLVWLADHVYQSLLFWRGFNVYSIGRLRYWYRQAEEGALETYDQPMVFFHGVGVGLAQYLTILPYMPHKTQVLVEHPWIAFNFWTTYHDPEPPGRPEYLDFIREIFRRHGIKQAEFVSQSFGTFQTGWVLNHAPELVSRVVMMDPVSMYLFLPNTAVSFLLRYTMGSYKFTGAKWFFRSELGIARQMSRYLFWYDVVVLPEQVPSGSLVIVHEDDMLLPADIIHSSLKDRSDVTCLKYEGDHGEFIWDPLLFFKWCQNIRTYYEMLGTKNYQVGQNPMAYIVKMNAGWDFFGIGKMLGIAAQVLQEMGHERALY